MMTEVFSESNVQLRFFLGFSAIVLLETLGNYLVLHYNRNACEELADYVLSITGS